MTHSNISIFVPHIGCPHKCSFCNQNAITGVESIPHEKDVRETLERAYNEIADKANTEVAFFGGSFTAIKRDYMLELLNAAQPFLCENGFKGIRVSTRPDYINDEVLTLLKEKGVTTIELGVQSMDDEVLEKNERGHSSLEVKKSAKLIKSYGFNLGLQMMVGLYGSTPEKDLYTANEIIRLEPSEVRIYPVVILKNTLLGKLFLTGEYVPYKLSAAVKLSAKLLTMFKSSNINVIKLGLHASEVVEKDLLGGLYHPAFRELCEAEIYKSEIEELLKDRNAVSAVIQVPKGNLSKAIGQKKSNIEYFKEKGIGLKIVEGNELSPNIKLIDIKER